MSRSISLNGNWTLYYELETERTKTEPAYLRGNAPHISATVPGNVELDLFRAGIEPDPFYAENIYRFRRYEFYCWQFERTVTVEKNDKKYELVFEGLNCFADVYVNDVPVGTAANAMIAHRFDVTRALKNGENLITVRISSALNRLRGMNVPAYVGTHETGQYMMLRMPPSSFGWDIMGRFLSAGMWRGVRIEELDSTRITDLYFATKSISGNGTARIALRYWWTTDDPIPDGYTLECEGRCAGSAFRIEKTMGFTDGVFDFAIPDARLWWPKGYGDAALYTVTTTLKKNGEALDSRIDRIGVRRVRVEHVMKPGDEGEFKVIVNDVPVFLKGTNWVPLDALHSRDAERLRRVHDLLEDAHCNVIRCWGGNVYEDNAFFDLCDERGMLVWQDFAMACARYSQESSFTAQIEEEASSVIKKLRNHPSILLWAGDNEVDEGLTDSGFADGNTYNSITREVLPRCVRMHDPFRWYLPSSPYIDKGIPRYDVPEQHNWGARAYFKDDFYKHTRAHFISECGYHGCPAVSSLKRYIPEEDLSRPYDNDVWDTHCTDYIRISRRGYSRIGLMRDQVDILFGSVPDDLGRFAALSQISQAEAKKFFIERARMKKWRRTGIIWWNMMDGWPQISDAVVDYYFKKKLAYYYIRRSQNEVCVMMDELVNWGHDVYAVNDTLKDRRVSVAITDSGTGMTVFEGTYDCPANSSVVIGNIREMAGRQKLYLIRYSYDGAEYGNHYISGYPSYDADEMLAWVDEIRRLPEPFDWDAE